MVRDRTAKSRAKAIGFINHKRGMAPHLEHSSFALEVTFELMPDPAAHQSHARPPISPISQRRSRKRSRRAPQRVEKTTPHLTNCVH
jgi:hypothetical protein